MADDLTKQALAAAKASIDLYALVGDVSPTAPVEDIRRAWRKRNLVLHPDKARDAFDPELYGRFSEALAILENAEARTAYDGAISAAQAQKRRYDEMDGERRRMVEDLLAREKAAAAGATGASQNQQQQKRKETAEERKRREMREMKEHDHRRLEEERERLRKEEEDSKVRSRRDEDDRLRRKEEDIERKIREKKKRRQRREQAHADRVARDGVPTSGPEAWAWTRKMLVQEQRLREARAAAQAQS